MGFFLAVLYFFSLPFITASVAFGWLPSNGAALLVIVWCLMLYPVVKLIYYYDAKELWEIDLWHSQNGRNQASFDQEMNEAQERIRKRIAERRNQRR